MISLHRVSHLVGTRYAVELDDGPERLTFEFSVDSRDGIDVVCWAPEFETVRETHPAVNFAPLFEAVLAVNRCLALPART